LAHQPPDVFRPAAYAPPNRQDAPLTTFASVTDARYLALLGVIRNAREAALKSPRVDMPGARVIPGKFRELPPLSPPASGAITQTH
jgi:hypothetical protein